MSIEYQMPIQTLVLEGDEAAHLARILHDWLEEGFQVEGPRQRLADALLAQLVAAQAARRV